MRKVFDGLVGSTTSSSQLALTWPVHKGSVRAQVVWAVIPRELAYKYYRLARRYNRDSRPDDRRGGRLGSAALRVLEALIFDFLSFTTGRLDPCYEQIARVAGLARSTVALALARLQAMGVIRWQRRCIAEEGEQGFRLVQQSNAYTVQPPSRWLGYKPASDDPPPPPSELLGGPPRVPEVIEAAAVVSAAGGSLERVAGELELAPAGGLEHALAGLARAMARSSGEARERSVRGSEDRTETGPVYKL